MIDWIIIETTIVFILIFAIIYCLYFIVTDTFLKRQQIVQRLQQMSENNPQFVKMNKVSLFQNKRKNIVERKINEYLIRIKKENEFKLIVERMGFTFTLTQFFLIYFGSVAIVILAVALINGDGLIKDVLIGLTITTMLFIFAINMKISIRQKKFLKELPFAIEILIRSVKSGFSLDRAFKIVSTEVKDPLSSELQNIVRKIELGVSFQQTFRNSSDRMKLRDYTFFCNALNIQHETGGHLEDILNNILYILKRRMDLQLKLKSITAEIKTTGIILGITPVGIWFIMQFIKPDFIDFFLHDPAGKGMFRNIIVMFITECLVIYYMLRIKVE